MDMRRTRQYVINSHTVTCTIASHGECQWHCDCADFVRRARTYREGFCPHVIGALRQASTRELRPLNSSRGYSS